MWRLSVADSLSGQISLIDIADGNVAYCGGRDHRRALNRVWNSELWHDDALPVSRYRKTCPKICLNPMDTARIKLNSRHGRCPVFISREDAY
jgi:hypothetical protein